ncbi:hypothetical protein GWI33_011410 [Rhynchophorus ferrugineus]|uniref:Uncharacterized protein n=1 Tax=Rhynchophorus ferrugineus TaxID=354439 RepID=A0A834MJ96_RHYFE|nr:hypothetical protein GWI33_011410 [Rhynchophorus ferrugineus]
MMDVVSSGTSRETPPFEKPPLPPQQCPCGPPPKNPFTPRRVVKNDGGKDCAAKGQFSCKSPAVTTSICPKKRLSRREGDATDILILRRVSFDTANNRDAGKRFYVPVTYGHI